MENLFAPVGPDFRLEDALESWRWLVPRPVAFVAMTALGDLFLQEEDTSVWFMDTIEGKYRRVADSVEQWRAMLHDPGRVDTWFMPSFVTQLRSLGLTLQEGECFSATVPPVIGGGFTPENWQPTSWRVHFWSPGQIHEQVKDLPPGTPIANIKFTPI